MLKKAEEVAEEVEEVEAVEEKVLKDGIDGKDGDRWEVELNIFQLQEFMLTSVNFLMAESITHLQDIELKYLGEYSKFYTQIKI